MDNPEVKCYSGHTFAERPTSFSWQGAGYEVEEVEKAWLEPGGKCFLVRSRDNKFFKLCYNEMADRWQITEYTRFKDLLKEQRQC